MFSRLHFNQQSRQLINNIWTNAKSHPMYAGYNVSKDEVSYSDAGAIAIILQSPRGNSNMFLFYPACNASGKIGSCAIYGTNLTGHKQAIERSMTLFGLPVDSVDWDEGLERFLDVSIKNY